MISNRGEASSDQESMAKYLRKAHLLWPPWLERQTAQWVQGYVDVSHPSLSLLSDKIASQHLACDTLLRLLLNFLIVGQCLASILTEICLSNAFAWSLCTLWPLGGRFHALPHSSWKELLFFFWHGESHHAKLRILPAPEPHSSSDPNLGGCAHRSYLTVSASVTSKVPEGHHPRGTTLREALEEICLSEGSGGLSQRALRGLSEGSGGVSPRVLRGSAGVCGIFQGFSGAVTLCLWPSGTVGATDCKHMHETRIQWGREFHE